MRARFTGDIQSAVIFERAICTSFEDGLDTRVPGKRRIIFQSFVFSFLFCITGIVAEVFSSKSWRSLATCIYIIPLGGNKVETRIIEDLSKTRFNSGRSGT